MLTCGKGQKVGIFAGSGVGKSTLMGMIVKGCEAQIKVIALIGERGREIPEFIHYNFENTIIVAVISDESALMKKYGVFAAMIIAEFYRDKGHDVLLMMDSVTRFAIAQREIGLIVVNHQQQGVIYRLYLHYTTTYGKGWFKFKRHYYCIFYSAYRWRWYE
jgi:flagellum-specific ATP synthase